MTMRSRNLIIPGCLALNREDFEARLRFASEIGNAIHLDVIDNDFVKGQTLPVEQWPEINLDYVEAHLMVRNPLNYIDKLKTQRVTRAIIHIESEFDLDTLAKQAKKIDLLLGFAINPDTDLREMKPYLVVSNYIQIMGNYPGKTGQEQLPQTLTAVSYFHSLINTRLVITVDIGVDVRDVAKLKQLGASYLIASSAIYNRGDWTANYQQLQKQLEGKDD